nr:hypothetical protein [Tanacetum cinerariifolium]
MVSSEPIGDISTKRHADIEMAPNDHSADVSDAVEDPNKSGSNDISLEYADGSHAVEDPNGTGPNHVAPHVEFVELGIPAVNCNREKAIDTTPSIQQEIHIDSHLLQQPSENGIQDQELQADPVGNAKAF